MIQEIKITNIGSFKDEATFSLIATGYSQKMNNVVIRDNSVPVLNSGIIYGANSSGKTQFIRALYDLREQLRGNRSWVGSQNLQDLFRPYKFSPTVEKPSKIEIQFDLNNSNYRYSVEYDSISYKSETLKKLFGKEWDILYSRIHDSAQQGHAINIIRNKETISFPVLPHVLGLSLMMSFENDELRDVAKYLANMQICNGYNWNMMEILWREVQNWLGNNTEKRRRKEQIRHFLNAVDVKQEGIEFPVSGDASFDKIMFVHKIAENNNSTKLNIMDESNGSKWLLLLGAKVIEAIENGYTLFVDELDACFHPQVTQAILNIFRNPNINPKNAQLVITTHNVNLMDEKELRRDQIWFVQKNECGCSELFSLADFIDVDENTPFSNWYLANRFGATPYISGLEKVFSL